MPTPAQAPDTPSDAPPTLPASLIAWPPEIPLVYPCGSLESYEERQAVTNALGRALTALNPHLIPFDPAQPKTRGVALAAKNARVLLKKAFPGQVFSVRSEKYSMGSSLNVEWLAWDHAPSRDVVDDLLSPFITGRFNGMIDEFEYNNDLLHEAFRKVFGSTRSVSAQTMTPSPEERAAHEQKVLRAVLGTPTSKARDGNGLATPLPQRPPRRL